MEVVKDAWLDDYGICLLPRARDAIALAVTSILLSNDREKRTDQPSHERPVKGIGRVDVLQHEVQFPGRSGRRRQRRHSQTADTDPGTADHLQKL